MSDSATPVPDPDPPSRDPESNDAPRGQSELSESEHVEPMSEADLSNGAVVREGSPFRVDPVVDPEAAASPFAPTDTHRVEAFYDIGPTRYMALGAVVAACVVMVFAVLSLIWFPGGGVLVSGLGCLLGILGLFSPRPKSSGGLLLGHIGLFVASYFKMVAS